jgi:hypothetical protein
VSRAGFWKRDGFLGLAVAALLFMLGPSNLLQSLERKAYDLGVRASDRTSLDGESMAQLMFRIANEAPPASTAFNPAAPEGIFAFLHRALAKDADARYQTGAVFATAQCSAMDAVKRGVPTVDVTL